MFIKIPKKCTSITSGWENMPSNEKKKKKPKKIYY